MKTNPERHYLDNSRLVNALVESQKLGYPTVEICECFLLIAWHLMNDSRFRNYPYAMKEDLVSDALLKSIKNIKNFKIEYAEKAFGYFTRCIEQSFFKSLGRHYKQENIKRGQLEDYIDILKSTSPNEAKYFESTILKDNTTNTLNQQEG